jgi:hypothetical protein
VTVDDNGTDGVFAGAGERSSDRARGSLRKQALPREDNWRGCCSNCERRLCWSRRYQATISAARLIGGRPLEGGLPSRTIAQTDGRPFALTEASTISR